MSPNQAIDTEGRLIRWPRFYDLLLKVFFVGRESRFREKILEVARLQPGERVLDVGSGTGTLTIAAARQVAPDGLVRGVEPAPEMVERARTKADEAGVSIDFEVGAVEALPIPDQSVDVALSSLVFHHLTKRLQREGFAEVFRVLAPGGRLVLVDFGRPGPKLDRVADAARAAGFDPVTVGRLSRGFFWLLAERD